MPPLRLTRSMLFVPATHWPRIEKAAASAADVVCIDLEDSVPLGDKAAARANVIRAFRELDFGRRVRMFRMNGLDTAFAYRDVIEVAEAAGDRIDLIMLPKAGSTADVAFVDRLLSQIEQNCGFRNSIGIEAQIETARGFLYVREIAQASPRLEALIFGPGDYAASMQMPSASIGEFDRYDSAYPGHRWHAAMHAIVAAARANGLRAMDGPFAAFQDQRGFERSAEIARGLGYDGKQCIHPAQLSDTNRIFTPSVDELENARRVSDAYDQAVSTGRGAAALDGRMIDAANIRMARVILDKWRLSRLGDAS